MPTRRQLIQKITLNASSTSVSFSNIPGNYTDLKLVSSARTDRGNNGDSVYIRFNGDTATNYKNRSLYGTGGSGVTITITSPVGIALVQGACGNSDTANTFGNSEAYIPNYTASTAKSATHRGTSETNAASSYMSLDFGLWTGTAAITSMTLVPGNGTNFLSGSTFYLYGITAAPIINGGEVSIRDGYKYHTFRSTGTLQVVEPGDVDYLIVAGGGSGGWNGGGGGGGGGALTGKTRVSVGLQTITIGAGAAIQSGSIGLQGSNSEFSGLVAVGGGAGGALNSQATARNGGAGGSGGGGATHYSGFGGPGTGGSGTSGQGNNGAAGRAATISTAAEVAGGGGGGASSSGTTPTTGTGGSGGTGISSGISGSSLSYAGGGGGGGGTAVGTGGSGVGGNGGGGSTAPTTGLANRGGGGGGGGNPSADGAAGGSGIVIIRYPYTGN